MAHLAFAYSRIIDGPSLIPVCSSRIPDGAFSYSRILDGTSLISVVSSRIPDGVSSVADLVFSYLRWRIAQPRSRIRDGPSRTPDGSPRILDKLRGRGNGVYRNDAMRA